MEVGLGYIGVGMVYRDHLGQVLVVCLKRIHGMYSVEDAELLAIQDGL